MPGPLPAPKNYTASGLHKYLLKHLSCVRASGEEAERRGDRQNFGKIRQKNVS